MYDFTKLEQSQERRDLLKRVMEQNDVVQMITLANAWGILRKEVCYCANGERQAAKAFKEFQQNAQPD